MPTTLLLAPPDFQTFQRLELLGIGIQSCRWRGAKGALAVLEFGVSEKRTEIESLLKSASSHLKT